MSLWYTCKKARVNNVSLIGLLSCYFVGVGGWEGMSAPSYWQIPQIIMTALISDNVSYNTAFKLTESNSVACMHDGFSFPIRHTDDISKQIPHWKCYKTIEALGTFGEHSRKKVALGCAWSNYCTSFLLSKLPACFNSQWSWVMHEPIINWIVAGQCSSSRKLSESYFFLVFCF